MENCADHTEEVFQESQEIPLASPLSLGETQLLLEQERDCADLFKSNHEKNTTKNEILSQQEFEKLPESEKLYHVNTDRMLMHLNRIFLYSLIILKHSVISSYMEEVIDLEMLPQLTAYRNIIKRFLQWKTQKNYTGSCTIELLEQWVSEIGYYMTFGRNRTTGTGLHVTTTKNIAEETMESAAKKIKIQEREEYCDLNGPEINEWKERKLTEQESDEQIIDVHRMEEQQFDVQGLDELTIVIQKVEEQEINEQKIEDLRMYVQTNVNEGEMKMNVELEDPSLNKENVVGIEKTRSSKKIDPPTVTKVGS